MVEELSHPIMAQWAFEGPDTLTDIPVGWPATARDRVS